MRTSLGVAGALGAVLGAVTPCRSGAMTVGLVLGTAGALSVALGRGSLPRRAVLARGRMLVWRRWGPPLMVLGTATALVGAVLYLIVGPGTCG